MYPKKIRLNVPRWAAYLYLILSLVLVPWTIYLGATLPVHHLSAHWDTAWVGLDIGLVVMLLATGVLAYRRSPGLILTAATAGSFLLVDAWFDIMSERSAPALHQAIVLAVVAELPLAIMSYRLAYKTTRAIQVSK